MPSQKPLFSPGEGLVGPDVDATIRNFGLSARAACAPTDAEIIRIMLGEQTSTLWTDFAGYTRMERG
jgi:L-cysteine desulfidase